MTGPSAARGGSAPKQRGRAATAAHVKRVRDRHRLAETQNPARGSHELGSGRSRLPGLPDIKRIVI
jgi:hypothetical protein